MRANNDCRRDILERLRADGPLPSSELPDTCVVPWRSSGWNNNRNLRMMLDKLVQRGEVAAAGGTGRDRLWDLASRIYPDDPVPPVGRGACGCSTSAGSARSGIARAKGTKLPLEPVDVGEAGEPAVVEGVRGAVAGRPGPARPAVRRPGGAAVAVRPAARRPQADGPSSSSSTTSSRCTSPPPAPVWGYYALPILYGDRLVGKLDATADRKEGELRVAAIHQDVPFSRP